MKTILSRMFATLVLLSTTSLATADEQRPTPQAEMVALKIRVLEATDRAAPRVLASPLIMTLTGREVHFESAGEVKSKFDNSAHEIGTRMTAKIDALSEKKYRLKFEASLGNATLPEQEPETEYFIDQKLTARTVVESGKMKKLHVSPDRWYEITVGDPKLMHMDRGNGLVPKPTTDAAAANR